MNIEQVEQNVVTPRVGPGGVHLTSLTECDLFFGAHGNHSAPRKFAGQANGAQTEATPTVNCPSLRDKLPAVPQQAVDEVDRNLALLDKQIAETNQRLATSRGRFPEDDHR